MPTFRRDLTEVINKHSKENGSNTPDFILAEYLIGCLKTFDSVIGYREQWYSDMHPVDPEYQKFLDRIKENVLSLNGGRIHEDSPEESAEKIIEVAKSINYHHIEARATLGEMPEVTPESLVDSVARTPEERKQILDILLRKTNELNELLDPTQDKQINIVAEPELEPNTITLNTSDMREVMKFCDDGNIYVKGKLTDNDKEVVEALREFLISSGYLTPKS